MHNGPFVAPVVVDAGDIGLHAIRLRWDSRNDVGADPKPHLLFGRSQQDLAAFVRVEACQEREYGAVVHVVGELESNPPLRSRHPGRGNRRCQPPIDVVAQIPHRGLPVAPARWDGLSTYLAR